MSVCLNFNVQEDFLMLSDHHHLLHQTLHHHNNNHNTSSDDDDDDLYAGGKTVRAPFIRSTSLKTGKTPPNTPGRSKKAVRFADSLGLEFECVKLISQDELPTVPRSAYQDLKLKDFTKSKQFNNFGKQFSNINFANNNHTINTNIINNNNNHQNYQRSSLTFTNTTNNNAINTSTTPTTNNNNNNNHHMNINTITTSLANTAITSKPKPQRKISPAWPTAYNPNCPNTLVPEFLQPIASTNFCDRVRTQHVCLENCIVSSGAGNISVTCVIRVLNIAFEKSVTVRHTLTEWQTASDSLASYLPNSCDGWSDKFVATFSIRSVSAGGTLAPGQRVSFAIRYTVGDDEYWDNNNGLNYSLYSSTI